VHAAAGLARLLAVSSVKNQGHSGKHLPASASHALKFFETKISPLEGLQGRKKEFLPWGLKGERLPWSSQRASATEAEKKRKNKKIFSAEKKRKNTKIFTTLTEVTGLVTITTGLKQIFLWLTVAGSPRTVLEHDRKIRIHPPSPFKSTPFCLEV